MRLFVTIATWIRPRLAVFAIICSVFAGLIKLTSAIYPLLLKDYIDALEDGVRDLEPVIAMALLFGITTLLEVVITVGYGRAHTSLERAIKLRVFKRATHLSSRNVKERGEGFFVNLIDEAVSACMQLFLPHTYAQLFALLKTVIIVIIVMQFDVVAALIMVLLLMLHCVQFLLNKRYFTPLLDTLYRLYREASAFITERIGLISLVEAFPSFRNTIVQDSERILDRVRRRTFRVELYSETLYRAVERYLQPPARFGLLLYLGLQYIAGVYDFGVLIMIITYYGSVEYGLTGLSHITEVYLRASVAVRAIDDFVGEPVKKHPPTLERKTFFFCVQDVEHSIDTKRILNRWSFRFLLGLTFGVGRCDRPG